MSRNSHVPAGGNAGQILAKTSNTDGDYGWVDPVQSQQQGGVTLAEVMAAIYPVGSIYTSVSDTDPATLFGGTWQAFGAGRVLVGRDGADTDFDAAEETGGSKTATPSGDVSQPTFTGSALAGHSHGSGTLVPSAHSGTAVADHSSHTHTYSDVVNHTHPVIDPGHNHTQNAHTHTIPVGATDDTSAPFDRADAGTNASGANATTATGSATATNNSATTGVTTGNPASGVAAGTTNGPSAALTHNVTQPSAHTMSGSTSSDSAGTPSGTVSKPNFTGNELNIVQPYIVVYFYKRTA